MKIDVQPLNSLSEVLRMNQRMSGRDFFVKKVFLVFEYQVVIDASKFMYQPGFIFSFSN